MNNDARRREHLHFFGVFLVVAALSGCAGDGAEPPQAAHQPATEATRMPETARLPAPSAPPARTPEPEINAPAPDEVIGWSADALNAAFGTAGLVRRDLGAEIWQYRTDQCVLLLFLYPRKSGDGAPLHVDHLDVGNGKDAGTCLKSVVRRHVLRTAG